jgi:RHS repeat-associated protein
VTGSAVSWFTTRSGGYGPLPGVTAEVLTDVLRLAEATAWRSRRIDPTGLYNMGARYYEPSSGRFLSPDPMGHAASMSLYDFCNGDPVNGFDPDGRIATRFGKWSEGALSNALSAVNVFDSNPNKRSVGGIALEAWDNRIHAAVSEGFVQTYGYYDAQQIQLAEIAITGAAGELLTPIRFSAAAENVSTRTLFHYTNEIGLDGIRASEELKPSLWKVGTKDVRYGNGQYLSDIAPGEMTPAQLSRAFLNQPFQGAKFTNFIEIDVSGLKVIQGRSGVFVVPNEVPLNLSGRIINSGTVPVPVKAP